MTANAPLLSAVPLHAPYQAHELSASSLQQSYRHDFYRLIQEQAAQHASAANPEEDETNSRALYAAVVNRRECNAFLVIDNESGNCLTAVTYTTANCELGEGLYLEDIVTTNQQRGKGAGSFALATLSQIAIASGMQYVAWECAAHNITAQNFYTHHGAAVHADRHTLRTHAPIVTTIINPRLVFEPLSHNNFPDLVTFLQEQDAHNLARRLRWLATKVGSESPLYVVAQEQCGRERTTRTVGFASAYSSFSTFRIVSGLHINEVVARDNDPTITTGLLTQLNTLGRARGWTGHTDITLHDHQAPWLQPIVQRCGFDPLTYGEDRMIVRSLSGPNLRQTSQRYGERNLIQNLRL